MKYLRVVLLCPLALATLRPLFGAQAPPQINQADSANQVEKATTGPFGFYCGETKDQAIAQIGNDSVKTQSPTRLEVTTAPKPYPEFEEFLLTFSTEKGLLRIVAIGHNITDDASGSQIRSR